MKTLISGATGLIGSALVRSLLAHGEQVSRMVRPGAALTEGTVLWDPLQGQLDPEALEGYDAVVHLAAENIAAERWTEERKKRIRESRVRSTGLLCNRLKGLKHPPSVFLVASAIGYYGDRGDELLTEQARSGVGFLADVTKAWEAASAVLDDSPIRVVRLRIGVVLSGEGGALARMLPLFRLGLGGRIGSGRQYMSWIAIDDLIRVIEYALTHDELSGPVNAVSPNPVTNNEFTKTLGKAISRPTFLSVPGFAMKVAAGQMADELLLSSTRVIPEKLLSFAFRFDYADLDKALRHVLR